MLIHDWDSHLPGKPIQLSPEQAESCFGLLRTRPLSAMASNGDATDMTENEATIPNLEILPTAGDPIDTPTYSTTCTSHLSYLIWAL